MSLDQVLAEAYASRPRDVVFDTLELRHPAFIDEFGQRTAIRVVIGHEDITARLEPDAPLHPDAYVLFQAGAFRFKLPGFEEARVPALQITLDGVSREVVAHVEAAAQEAHPIEVTYRPYLADDLSKPRMDPPITMTLTRVSVTGVSVTGTATLADVHNWPFPAEKYLRSRFPGLFR